VRDNRLTVGKRDLRAVKYVFLGYSATQKGYACWSPGERRLLSMDMTFHESDSYFPSRVGPLFDDLSNDGEIRREGEKYAGERSIQLEAVSAPISRQESAEGDESEEEEENVVTEGEENQAQGELRYVYQRRKDNVSVPIVPPMLSSLS
jgi:hypothetical protein